MFPLLLFLLLAHPSKLLLKLDINDINENSHAVSSATLPSVTLPMTTPRWRRLPLLRKEEESMLELLLRGYIDRQFLEEQRAPVLSVTPSSLTLTLTTPHTTPATDELMPDQHPQWFYPKSNPSQKPIVLPLNVLEEAPLIRQQGNLGNGGVTDNDGSSFYRTTTATTDKCAGSTGVGEEAGDLVATDSVPTIPYMSTV